MRILLLRYFAVGIFLPKVIKTDATEIGFCQFRCTVLHCISGIFSGGTCDGPPRQ